MLFRLRQTQGKHYLSGNWIGPDGQVTELPSSAIEMVPTATTEVANRKLPTSWRIAIPDRNLKIDTAPLNLRSWMGASFAYWEGPISFTGSHRGVGYLEMTGY
jgi:predicted secreted hydrolase